MDTHRIIFEDDNKTFALKALRTSAIPESPVLVILNGVALDKFQGIEFFLRNTQNKSPLAMVDIICNSYLRLTYNREDGTTATLGTSVISAPSFRVPNEPFHLVPKIRNAMIDTGTSSEVKVSLFGTYDDLAEVVITKWYSTELINFYRLVKSSTQFSVLKDIALDPSTNVTDRFRLFSLASMYAQTDRYDSNILRFRNKSGIDKDYPLSQAEQRGTHLFGDVESVSRFEMINEGTSQGMINTPGSPDAPSTGALLGHSSLSKADIGLQAYLASSKDVNDDSLSAWLEWTAAPSTIQKGTSIKWTAQYTAYPPGITSKDQTVNN